MRFSAVAPLPGRWRAGAAYSLGLWTCRPIESPASPNARISGLDISNLHSAVIISFRYVFIRFKSLPAESQVIHKLRAESAR